MKSYLARKIFSVFSDRKKQIFKSVLDGKILQPPRTQDPCCRIRFIALADVRIFSYNEYRGALKEASFWKTDTVVAVASGNAFDLFIKKILPKVRNAILLMVLDYPYVGTDSSVSCKISLLDDDCLKHIFAENWLGDSHPKLTILPIGLESPFADGSLYGHTTESKFIEIGKNTKAVKDKPFKILVNAHLNEAKNPASGSYNQREEMARLLRDSPLCDFWSKRESREKTWGLHDNYAFELCPEGNGLDTHRFYEALWLNTIPIVKRNSLAPLYEKFPCVIVDHWLEINERLLEWSVYEFSLNRKALLMEPYINLLNSFKGTNH